jgi:bacterioferritin-associated ferredoxin
MNTARKLTANSDAIGAPQEVEICVGARTHDQVTLKLTLVEGVIESATLKVIGCTTLLRRVQELRRSLRGPLKDVVLPEGSDHAAMLLRETVLKAQGLWNYPYSDEEICHCRAVSTAKVDGAILAGCHSVDAIKSATSASTSCGTCLPDVEKVLRYRLKS